MWLRLSKGKTINIGGCIFNHAYRVPLGIRCIVYTVSTGIGTWGLNLKQLVGHWDILLRLVGWYWSRWNVNFCGTVILFRQRWRMAINRSAETMIFSPLSKLVCFNYMGRPWLLIGY
jgi:molybdopterin-containing oxidoreductase family membrane subunit